jgi:hypothetical protein
MWIGAGNGRASRRVRSVVRCRLRGRRDLFGLVLGRESAFRISLGQDLDRQVGTVALAQAASDAVGGLDDRIVGQYQRVFGADLDTDIAAFAPLVDPTDIDEVNDGWSAMRSSFGNVRSSRSGISRGGSGTLIGTPVAQVYVIDGPAACLASPRPIPAHDSGLFRCVPDLSSPSICRLTGRELPSLPSTRVALAGSSRARVGQRRGRSPTRNPAGSSASRRRLRARSDEPLRRAASR